MSETDLIPLRQAIAQLVSPDEQQWRQFAGLFQPRALDAGDYFIRAGEMSERLAFVNSGLLRFFYTTPDGREFNKSFSRENEFAGAYSAYLAREPARFAIQALEPCRLLAAKIDDIVALFERDLCWQKLGRLLVERLYVKKEQREAELLLDDAASRYRRFQQAYPGLEQRLPQYHVASYLGITPVALSRIRHR